LRQQAVQRLLVVAGLLLSLGGCASRTELHVLRVYFDTCALADEAALAGLALVALDPQRHGVVGRFTVTGRSAVDVGAWAASAARLSWPPSPDQESRTARLEGRDVEVLADLHHDGAVHPATLRVTLARVRSGRRSGRWIVVRLVLDGQTVTAASSAPP
jgi:hypothetical protein